MFFRLSSSEQTKTHVNDYFHSSFKTATKKDFAILLARNWHLVTISRETKSEQKTRESEAECCLLDRQTQPRGRHLQHLFQIPIVSASGDWAESCSQPRDLLTPFLEPRPVLLLTVFSLWSKFLILISLSESTYQHAGDTHWSLRCPVSNS